MIQNFTAERIIRSRRRIAPFILTTPLVPSPELTEVHGPAVFLKLESLQRTGSFKIRGAANRLLALDERDRGVVACSSGNHGRAVAEVARRMELGATICVPEWVDPGKLEAIRRTGAEAILAGDTYDEADEEARRLVRERGAIYVHPFDDLDVIAGQGTVGLEILDQLPAVDTVVVPLSGGGLIAGTALAVRSRRPETRVVGVSAERAAVMLESLGRGGPVVLPEKDTLANALSGGIGLDNRYSFELVRDLVQEHVRVTEDEIAGAIRFAFRHHGLVVEGGGAVGLAALLAAKVRPRDGPLAIVVSGGNIHPHLLREILA